MTITTRSIVLIAVLAATASLPRQAAAQTARPGVDCSLLTATQAAGLPCANAPKPNPPSVQIFVCENCGDAGETAIEDGGPDGFEAMCTPRPNPYAEPRKAAACAAWDRAQRPRPDLPTYDVGATYAHPYQAWRMIVLGIGSSLEGVPVVTAQYTAGPDLIGTVFAFKVNEGTPWTVVR